MIKVEIRADSITERGHGTRLTSFLLTYPRFIHSELMTHRVFSRNASSSRAIPVKKMIAMLRENPAMPVEWGKNQKGMQAEELLDKDHRMAAEGVWKGALHGAISSSEALLNLGVHKQVANRILEPWAHMTTLVTATDWGNFFRLRAHPDAQPEFQELAFEMLEHFYQSIPVGVEYNSWHLPFDRAGDDQFTMGERLKLNVARCARTSYLTFDGNHDPEADIALCDRLLESGHMSPFEHIATPSSRPESRFWNFRGWMPYRFRVDTPKQHLDLTLNEIEDLLAKRPKRCS